jgi:hypothetical protein
LIVASQVMSTLHATVLAELSVAERRV